MYIRHLCQFARFHQAVVGVQALARQAVQLLGMGREDASLGQAGDVVAVLAQQVQGIGIDHHRRGAGFYLLQQGGHRLGSLPQPGTDTHRLVVVGIGSGGKAGVADVQFGHRFRDGSLHNGVVAERHVYRQPSHARTQAAARRQDRGSCHALRTGYQQRAPEVSLMGKPSAGLQQGGHLLILQHIEVGLHLINRLLAQPDVQQFPFAHIGLVLREEERQLRQLQAQGEVGTHDVRRHVIGVVLAHQPGGDVNGDHLRRRGVDILHHGGESAGKRLVEPAAEETVHHHVVFRQRRGDKLRGDFVEVHARHARQPLLVRRAIRRERAFGIEEIDFQPISLRRQQTGDGERVASVVARSGEYGQGRFRVPASGNRFRQRPGGALHQVNGGNRFIFYGIGIQLLDACCGKYLHNRSYSFF